jgi:hypothetical protein
VVKPGTKPGLFLEAFLDCHLCVANFEIAHSPSLAAASRTFLGIVYILVPNQPAMLVFFLGFAFGFFRTSAA